MELGPGPEFDRIRRILQRLGPKASAVGDDCALVRMGHSTLALSTDLSLEDVHFRRSWISEEEIGWRATAAALSDLAAEGAKPIGVLASIGVPAQDSGEPLQRLMDGVGEAASSVGAQVLGGDLAQAKSWIVNLTVIGSTERPVERSGGMAGDNVWVTGVLGGARAALERWLAGSQPDAAARQAFAHPLPRIAAGRCFADLDAHAMIDLSDGLAGDAGHLAAASGCAVAIDLGKLPIHSSVPEAARLAGIPPERYAALGGEDYELLVALPPEFGEREAQSLGLECGVAVTRIGTLAPGQGASFWSGGTLVELTGFSHFT